MIKVILFVVLMAPDGEPTAKQYDQPSIEACYKHVGEILKMTAPRVIEQGGGLQAGCAVFPNTEPEK